MESQDKKKPFGLKRIFNSVKNSISGLIIAYKNEQSMTLQLLASILLIIVSIICKISRIEWMIVIAIIGLGCTIELLNTAIENVTDLLTDKFHPLAKAAKDTASAAEFVLCIISFLITLLIFIPKIKGWL